MDAPGGTRQPLCFLEVATTEGQLRLQGVGRKEVRIQAGALGQGLLGLVEPAGAQQRPGALQVQVGVLRVQLDRPVDRLQRCVHLAGEALRGGQHAVCLGILRLLRNRFPGERHCLVCGATAQGIGDVVVHGFPWITAGRRL